MKNMNLFKKYGSKANLFKTAIATSALTLSVNAFAEIPDSVKTEITSAKGDVTEMVGLVLGVLVLFFAFKIIKRFF